MARPSYSAASTRSGSSPSRPSHARFESKANTGVNRGAVAVNCEKSRSAAANSRGHRTSRRGPDERVLGYNPPTRRVRRPPPGLSATTASSARTGAGSVTSTVATGDRDHSGAELCLYKKISLVEDQPKRLEIGPLGGGFSLEPLGRHVGQGSGRRPQATRTDSRRGRSPRCAPGPFRQSSRWRASGRGAARRGRGPRPVPRTTAAPRSELSTVAAARSASAATPDLPRRCTPSLGKSGRRLRPRRTRGTRWDARPRGRCALQRSGARGRPDPARDPGGRNLSATVWPTRWSSAR